RLIQIGAVQQVLNVDGESERVAFLWSGAAARFGRSHGGSLITASFRRIRGRRLASERCCGSRVGRSRHFAPSNRAANADVYGEETWSYSIISGNQRLAGSRIQIKVAELRVLQIRRIGPCGGKCRSFGEQAVAVGVAPSHDVKGTATGYDDK